MSSFKTDSITAQNELLNCSEKRIAVIGSGVIGLSVVQNLIESLVQPKELLNNEILGYCIDIYSCTDLDDTISRNCGGLWEPYEVIGTSDANILKWSSDTLNHFLKWHFQYAGKAGIQLVSSYTLFESNVPEIPFWTEAALDFKPLYEEDLRLLNVPLHFKSGYKFETVIVDQKYYLPFLIENFTKNCANNEHVRVNFIQHQIANLSDFVNQCNYDVVVNCTGLAAGELCNDSNVFPIRGQVLRIKAPWMKANWNFGKYYIIPNIDNVVIGGTAQYDVSDTIVSEADSIDIIRNIALLFPDVVDSPVEKVWVGLRPARKSGCRCEGDIVYPSAIGNQSTNQAAAVDSVPSSRSNGDGNSVLVCHCYGHGGSGVTLSMGCAKEIVTNHILPFLFASNQS